MAKVLIGKGLRVTLQQDQSNAVGSSGDHVTSLPLLHLPSPATGTGQQFVLLPGTQGLLEINCIRHEYGAWLIGDRLMSDGGCYLCTPVDPVFILLALLDLQQHQHATCGGGSGRSVMFQEASSLLCIDSWPSAAALEEVAIDCLRLICDLKGSGDDCYYRLNEQKVLAWMRCKLRQTIEGLRAAAPGSVAGLQGDDALSYALGFMTEYLSQKRLTQLAESFGLQPTGIGSATPATRPAVASSSAGAAVSATPPHGVAAQEDASQARDKACKVMDPKEAARKKQEEGRAEAKAVRLAKQAQGTRKISSFFAAAGAKK